MVSMAYAEKIYKTTMVQTAPDALSLIIMLYDGAIEHVDHTIFAMEKKDYEKKSYHISKFTAIIEELLCSLDYEKGGIIAENLRDVYLFVLNEVPRASLRNDKESFSKIKHILSELRSAWREIR